MDLAVYLEKIVHNFGCYHIRPTASGVLLAVKYLIAMLFLAAFAPTLRAEIYECVDANGNPRYTNITSEAKGCKLVTASLPSTASSAQPQGKAAATPVTPEPLWLAAARADPDPSVRLQAIEDWARGPQETLDPVTYALVDPDESVRARAQQLWEEALKRR
jgi:hypothetical protein